jgi:hypothetical protein
LQRHEADFDVEEWKGWTKEQVMKFKLIHNRAQEVSYLTCTTDKKITLDYRQAQSLAANNEKYLLPFSFSEDQSRAELFYFINHTYSLTDFLKYALSYKHIAVLLRQVVRMLDTCTAKGFLSSNICFDAQYVYLGSKDLRLKFIYLPVTGLQPEDRLLLKFLIHLVSNAQPKDDEAARYIVQVLDYFRRQEVFSLIKLKSFLKMDHNHQTPVLNKNTMEAPDTINTGELYRDFVTEYRKNQGSDD